MAERRAGRVKLFEMGRDHQGCAFASVAGIEPGARRNQTFDPCRVVIGRRTKQAFILFDRGAARRDLRF